MDYKIIIDRSRPYESACEILGRSPVTIDHFSFLDESERQYALSMHRVNRVIEAQKQSRKFDWNDHAQWKYSPWWDMETYEGQEPGSGFSYDDYCFVRTATDVGARLCSFSEQEVQFIAEVMKEDYLVIMKDE